MKLLYASLFFLLAFTCVQAKQIDPNTAMLAGKSFLTNQTNSHKFSGGVNLTLAYTGTSGAIGNNTPANLVPYFYIFNVNTTQGFVIVSATDNVTPVFAYSDQRAFDANKIAQNAAKYLGKYKAQVRYVLEHNIAATPAIASAWTNLLSGAASQPVSRGSRSVTPLCTTTWDQSPFYNDACPYDSAAAKHCVTGCPATAMAQIMRFWSYPLQGTGIATYNTEHYGQLTANLGATTFNWANMPNNVTTANADVAQLMYSCGVAVHMGYTASESGAYVIISDDSICSQSAFTTYFGYNPATIQGLRKDDFADTAWTTLIKTDLDNGHPIQYAGFGPGGGHTWVCDGYDQNDFFHMNWGWSGYDDGYYSTAALNPGTGGIGSGDGAYNSGEEALVGIVPLPGTSPIIASNLQLNSAITVTPSPINFLSTFTVNADIINNTAAAFNGTFAAMLFDAEGNFITILDTFATAGTPLALGGGHYNGGLTFTSAALLTVPGNYSISINYKPNGGNWYQVGSTSFNNPVTIAIASPFNNIDLYSNITTSAVSFTQGRSGSVTVNLINNGANTFHGTYQADLIDVHTNVVVQALGTYTETTGLASGSHYNTPITFTCPAVTAEPGTYILAITTQETDSLDLLYAGGSNYTNPINIDVVAAPISPDQYEADDTTLTAHLFPLTFTGNSDSVNTELANVHNGNDVDYYKFNLPAGYNYTVSSILYNASFDLNAQQFSLDAITSYSTDNGATWSAIYDGGAISNYTVANGGTIYYEVAPLFPGQTGTYQLNVKFLQSPIGAIQNVEGDALFSVYPNPASGLVTVVTEGQAGTLSICDIQGREIQSAQLTQASIKVDVSKMSKGLYIIKLQNGEQTSSKKLVIE